jgi:5'-3' exoribonuclease 1
MCFRRFIQFFPSDKTDNEKFREVVDARKSGNYYPSFKAAQMVGISGRALSKITSSFMVIMSDNAKINLGLSLKFEAKALKVIDYSRKDGKHWEFSEKAVELIREYRVRTSLVLVGADVDWVVAGQVSGDL